MKISDMFPEERPREKAWKQGVSVLTTAELLAVILRSGTPGGRGALDLARELLSLSDGHLTALRSMSQERMEAVSGIGPGKAVILKAALELGNRLFLEEVSGMERLPITGPDPVFARMLPRLRGLDHEECWAVFLNHSRRIIGEERLSIGGMNETVLDVQSLVRRSLEKKASYVILVHNHPSGDPTPGEADVRMTRRLQMALKVMGLTLLDHLVVSDGSFYSFESETVSSALPSG